MRWIERMDVVAFPPVHRGGMKQILLIGLALFVTGKANGTVSLWSYETGG